MDKSSEYFSLLHHQFKLIVKEIKKANRIVVFRHEVPDFDALGTQMGLVTWIKENYPEKEVHYVGEGMHSFIPRIFPEPEVLDEKWYDEDYLAIVVDTSNVARISLPHLDKASQSIKMDHHPEVEQFCKISCVHPEMSSCSELVALMLISMGGRRTSLSKNAARYFYIGMVGDSGRFMYPETSPMTLRIAADLLATGINKEAIYSEMYFTSKNEFEFKKWVLTNYKISKGGTAYYVLSDKDLKKLGLVPGDGKIHLSLFRNVEGISSEFSVTEDVVKGEYRISFRSDSKPVSKVAAMFNGGGHLFAAGGKMKSLDELPSLIKALDELKPIDPSSKDA